VSGVVYCDCGHTGDEHRPGLGCQHVNPESKRFPSSAGCHCGRLTPNGDIGDPDEFVAKQLNHVVAKQRLPLEPVDRVDLVQVMGVSLWRAARKYDSRSHIRFGSFAAFELYQDALDEIRSSRMFGRQGQHRLPPPLPSGTDGDEWHIDPIDPHDEQDRGENRLARIVAELTVDPPDAGTVDLRWVKSQGDCETLRAARERRYAAGEGAEGGDRVPAWHLGLAALTATIEEAA
jgi:hypothetical protein